MLLDRYAEQKYSVADDEWKMPNVVRFEEAVAKWRAYRTWIAFAKVKGNDSFTFQQRKAFWKELHAKVQTKKTAEKYIERSLKTLCTTSTASFEAAKLRDLFYVWQNYL